MWDFVVACYNVMIFFVLCKGIILYNEGNDLVLCLPYKLAYCSALVIVRGHEDVCFFQMAGELLLTVWFTYPL